MGNFIFGIREYFPPREPLRLLLLGLDAAGKTTVLYKLKNGSDKAIKTIPTIGLNIETLNFQGNIVTAWDVGGRSRVRPLAKHYYKETYGIIFVIDSNDHDRMDHARDELYFAIDDQELQGKPLLVLCNKQDLPSALSPSEIAKKLKLDDKCKGRKWNAVACTAKTGEGLCDGFAWMSTTLVEDTEDVSVATGDTDAMASESSSETIEIDFDPTEAGGNLTLKHFQAIKNGTECPFAKSAKLWGGCRVPTIESTLEEQAEANVAALTEFVRRSDAGDKLDGFCIELTDPKALSGSPKEFGECVRRLLTALSDHDPAGEAMMRKSYIASRGWRFRFSKADFFVTTFAPCYPPTSSRYAFGAGRAFLLLQPEASFARHDLPFDTADTNWKAPKTIRDKTRVAFREAGRDYFIPKTTGYPPAEHIVKPLRDDGTSSVPWWRPRA